ncbi:MAG: IgGFc-binding protein, partial [Bacteroidales bacterium]|nr:IgGFc-binding protein [Bacteroidales bacterium]
MKKILILIIFSLIVIKVFPQSAAPSTEGKEFWVTFMKNAKKGCYPNAGGDPNMEKLRLTIIARNATTGTIVNPNTGYTQNFVVGAMQVTEVTIPYNEAYTDVYGSVVSTGLVITSLDNISIYASNQANTSFDATIVLPVRCLGKEYSITTAGTRYYLDNCGGVFAAQFAILATTNNTRVRITPKLATNDGKPKNVPFEITLNRGQVYMVGAEHPAGSSQLAEYKVGLTGSWVEVVQGGQIAVFQGNSQTYELSQSPDPQYQMKSSHTYDQTFPIKYCGKQLASVMIDSNPTSPIFLTITGLYDNTSIVHTSGNPFDNLNKGESNGNFYDIDAIALNADKPCTIHSTYNINPSITMIASREQACKDFIITTPEHGNATGAFIDIIALTAHANSVQVNNANIYMNPIPETPEYSYGYTDILTNQVYTVTSQSGVIASVVSTNMSYGFMCSIGGSMLTQFMYIDDILSNEIASNQKYCVDVPIDFRSE